MIKEIRFQARSGCLLIQACIRILRRAGECARRSNRERGSHIFMVKPRDMRSGGEKHIKA